MIITGVIDTKKKKNKKADFVPGTKKELLEKIAAGYECGIYPCTNCLYNKARDDPSLCPVKRLARIGAKIMLDTWS